MNYLGRTVCYVHVFRGFNEIRFVLVPSYGRFEWVDFIVRDSEMPGKTILRVWISRWKETTINRKWIFSCYVNDAGRFFIRLLCGLISEFKRLLRNGKESKTLAIELIFTWAIRVWWKHTVFHIYIYILKRKMLKLFFNSTNGGKWWFLFSVLVCVYELVAVYR